MRRCFTRALAVVLVALMFVPLFVIQASAATTFERKLGVPVDYQFNYKTVRYGTNKSCASSGCGAASASMVVEYFTGNTSQNPDTLFKWACDNGWYTGSGLSYAAVKKLCSNYGVTLTWVGTQSEIINALKAGNPIIALMGPGTFTSGGHYIVLSGIKIVDGTTYIRVNDPNSSSRTNSYYTLSLIWSEKRTSSSTPFGVCTYTSAPKGAVSDFYVESGKYSKVESSDGFANIRSSASSSGSILGTVPSGTFLQVKSISGSWSYVTYNGVSGYVSNSLLVDGGDPSVAAPSLSVASTLAYGSSLSVSWGAVSNATSYKYTAKLYQGEISATTGTVISSGTTASTSFTVPAQSSGKYIQVSVTATDGSTSGTSTATVMVGPWVGYPTDVQYIPLNATEADGGYMAINGSTSSSNSTIWTSANTSTFTAVYWRAFMCSPNADGTYNVDTIYEYGASKSVTVSGTKVLFAIHSSYTNYSYTDDIKVGDDLTFAGIYLDKNTVRGNAHVLVNGGIPLGPDSLTIKSGSAISYSSDYVTSSENEVDVAAFVAQFNEDSKYISIKNAGGAVITSGPMCTGYTVNLVINGEVKQSNKVVVEGDVDGDGSVTTSDYLLVKSHIISKITVTDVYAVAGDYDTSNTLDTTDLMMFKLIFIK